MRISQNRPCCGSNLKSLCFFLSVAIVIVNTKLTASELRQPLRGVSRMPRCVWDDWYWSKGVLTESGPRVFMLFYRHLYSQCLGMGHRNCSFGLLIFDSTPFAFSFGPPLDLTLTAAGLKCLEKLWIGNNVWVSVGSQLRKHSIDHAIL